jgi:hypothetical protein
MGSYRRDRSHRESQLGRINYRKRHRFPALTLGAPFGTAALPDPAPRCGENSRPGKVRHRLEDSRKAILWFHHTRLSSDLGCVFGTNVANSGNRVAKFLALTTFGFRKNQRNWSGDAKSRMLGVWYGVGKAAVEIPRELTEGMATGRVVVQARRQTVDAQRWADIRAED